MIVQMAFHLASTAPDAATPASDPGWSVPAAIVVVIGLGIVFLVLLRITRRWAKTQISPPTDPREAASAAQAPWFQAGQRAEPADIKEMLKPDALDDSDPESRPSDPESPKA